MADATPFLSQPDSIDSKCPPTLDEAIEQYIGDFGWTQFIQAMFIALGWAFDAQQTFISIFTDVEPTWHCIDESCNSVTNVCQLANNSSWSWDLPVHSSIVSEWGLECGSSLLRGLPASSFFMGCLVGGLFLTTLADSSLGRKNMIFLSCLVMSVSALFATLSTNIWMYSAWRFVSGIGRAAIGTCALVLSTEIVGKRWRGLVGALGFFCFTIGFLSLPAIAYINRGSSWRTLYLWTSIPAVFYSLIFHLFVYESPRWLYVQGHKHEAISILNSIASHKNDRMNISFSDVISCELETENDVLSAMKNLFGETWTFRRLLKAAVISFGIGMVYYGMPLGLGNLSFDLYTSVAFNALAELPAALVTIFVEGKLYRRCSLLFFTILSGICSIMCALIIGKMWTTLEIGLELVAFFSSCTAFNILLIYTIELFPTCIRNSAISMVRQALVMGGIFSPLLVAAGRGNELLSYGLFASSIGLCGLFVVGLPETKGRPLSDTMEDEERKDKAAFSNKA